MSNTSFRRLALSGHLLPPLCGPDNLTRCLAEAKPIRQTHPSPFVHMHGLRTAARRVSLFHSMHTEQGGR
jgi:hypothetical protein